MYAIVKTGGKQYRVEQGQSLVVERLPSVAEGDSVDLSPLLYVDGDSVLDGEDLAKVSVSATVLGHERGPKLRVVKFKPKRGYKRRNGHRQELTRLEVTSIKLAARRARAAAGARAGEEGGAPPADPTAAPKAAAKPRTGTKASEAEGAPPKPRAPRAAKPKTETQEDGDGA